MEEAAAIELARVPRLLRRLLHNFGKLCHKIGPSAVFMRFRIIRFIGAARADAAGSGSRGGGEESDAAHARILER